MSNNVELIEYSTSDDGGSVDFKLRCTACQEPFTIQIASAEADDFKEMIDQAEQIFCGDECEKEYEKATAIASGTATANEDVNKTSADTIAKAIGS